MQLCLPALQRMGGGITDELMHTWLVGLVFFMHILGLEHHTHRNQRPSLISPTTRTRRISCSPTVGQVRDGGDGGGTAAAPYRHHVCLFPQTTLRVLRHASLLKRPGMHSKLVPRGYVVVCGLFMVVCGCRAHSI